MPHVRFHAAAPCQAAGCFDMLLVSQLPSPLPPFAPVPLLCSSHAIACSPARPSLSIPHPCGVTPVTHLSFVEAVGHGRVTEGCPISSRTAIQWEKKWKSPRSGNQARSHLASLLAAPWLPLLISVARVEVIAQHEMPWGWWVGLNAPMPAVRLRRPNQPAGWIPCSRRL